MAIYHKKPEHLADVVYEELQKKKHGCPDIVILQELFEILFFTSLETEEGKPIQLQIIYLDPKNPDPEPPERIEEDRWSFIPLEKSLPYNVANSVKLACALDPRTSSLVVYPNQKGRLRIWGLIDQVNRFHDFIHYESEVGPEMPGFFQAVALGIGHIIAYNSYRKIAELRINSLIIGSNDVLRYGPVRKQLEPSIDRYIKKVRNLIGPHIYDDRDHWKSSLEGYWVATLCRLLLRTKAHNHGGAFLVTPEISSDCLRTKYRINYDRLCRALINQGVLQIKSTNADDQIFTDCIDNGADYIPTDLYLEKIVDEDELSDCKSEIDASIWFISLLSRVDGLVHMNPDLSVKGFGTEIHLTIPIDRLYRSTGPMAASGSLKKVDFEQFGTRHRSMIRYCSHVNNSVGFVISQDGGVRAISKVNRKVVIWEDIRLQLVDFIRKKRRGR